MEPIVFVRKIVKYEKQKCILTHFTPYGTGNYICEASCCGVEIPVEITTSYFTFNRKCYNVQKNGICLIDIPKPSSNPACLMMIVKDETWKLHKEMCVFRHYKKKR